MDATLTALLVTSFITAVVHTVAGPDHYLPFVAISKGRGYSLGKTLLWTFVCGICHIASALLIALCFVYFSHFLTKETMEWLEMSRAKLAAYLMIGLGGAYLIYALHRRLKRGHTHAPHDENGSLMPWVIFIIFVLGPCEALLPLLTASSVLGNRAIFFVTLLFSVTTIATMMLAVAVGVMGISVLQRGWFMKLGAYSHELVGGTVMACGLAITFFGL